jgi:hypothetical protein
MSLDEVSVIRFLLLLGLSGIVPSFGPVQYSRKALLLAAFFPPPQLQL